MTLTVDEIVADYKAAKNRLKQVGILAEQACCSKQEIVKVLQDAGQDVPKNFLIKRKPAQPNAKAEKSYVDIAFESLREIYDGTIAHNDKEANYEIFRQRAIGVFIFLDRLEGKR